MDQRAAADEIADIENGPGAQHIAPRQLAGGLRHQHQIIAGEQFGAVEHDQTQAEPEHDASLAGSSASMPCSFVVFILRLSGSWPS